LKLKLPDTLELDRPQNNRSLIGDELEVTGKLVVVTNRVLIPALSRTD
jgi:hypothetical protein